MGCYDTINFDCPECGNKMSAQSKGGQCNLADYNCDNVPIDVASDANRHAPFKCDKCGTSSWLRGDVPGIIKVEPVVFKKGGG